MTSSVRTVARSTSAIRRSTRSPVSCPCRVLMPGRGPPRRAPSHGERVLRAPRPPRRTSCRAGSAPAGSRPRASDPGSARSSSGRGPTPVRSCTARQPSSAPSREATACRAMPVLAREDPRRATPRARGSRGCRAASAAGPPGSSRTAHPWSPRARSASPPTRPPRGSAPRSGSTSAESQVCAPTPTPPVESPRTAMRHRSTPKPAATSSAAFASASSSTPESTDTVSSRSSPIGRRGLDRERAVHDRESACRSAGSRTSTCAPAGGSCSASRNTSTIEHVWWRAGESPPAGAAPRRRRRTRGRAPRRSGSWRRSSSSGRRRPARTCRGGPPSYRRSRPRRARAGSRDSTA